jgi:hypothetical protein
MLYIQGAQSDRYFGWNNPKRTVIEHTKSIVSDGSGYYAYLPAWFIYDDIHFNFLDSIHKKYETNNFIQGIGYNSEKQVKTDKYYIGTALMTAPFFLINHGINLKLYGEGDGYSKSYQFTVSIAALFYWLLGIIGLIKVLRLFQINNSTILWTLGFLTFGTFGNYYTVYNPSFSHVFSFCVITWFFYFCKKWASTDRHYYLIHLSILLGLIFLLRPTNAVIGLIIPFFFVDWKAFATTFKALLTKHYLILFAAILIFSGAIFSQIYTIYCQIGEWKLNTYNEEGFDFLLDPQIFNVLFSYRKGLFTYSPILILIIPGIYFLFRKNRYFAWGWLLVSSIILYITASWWCWYYGGGLGMRPYFDLFVMLAIPMALFIQATRSFKRLLLLAVSGLLIYYYQTVQVQMNQNILHYSEMDKASYWKIFMKTDARFNWMLHLKEDQLPEKKGILQQDLFFNGKENRFDALRPIHFNTPFSFSNGPIAPVMFRLDSVDRSPFVIQVKGDITIDNPTSNAVFVAFYYQDTNIVYKGDVFIGNKIDHLNQFTHFDQGFYPSIEFSEIDSVRLEFFLGNGTTRLKDLEYRLLKY